MKTYRTGIDIGSTTVKLVLLDEENKIVYGQYRRHHANTQSTLAELLREARQAVGECGLKIKITGSGAINLGKALGINFVQEVVAVASALKTAAPPPPRSSEQQARSSSECAQSRSSRNVSASETSRSATSTQASLRSFPHAVK